MKVALIRPEGAVDLSDVYGILPASPLRVQEGDRSAAVSALGVSPILNLNIRAQVSAVISHLTPPFESFLKSSKVYQSLAKEK